MRILFFFMLATILSCNDSATGTKPVQDNAQNKDTTKIDSLTQ